MHNPAPFLHYLHAEIQICSSFAAPKTRNNTLQIAHSCLSWVRTAATAWERHDQVDATLFPVASRVRLQQAQRPVVAAVEPVEPGREKESLKPRFRSPVAPRAQANLQPFGTHLKFFSRPHIAPRAKRNLQKKKFRVISVQGQRRQTLSFQRRYPHRQSLRFEKFRCVCRGFESLLLRDTEESALFCNCLSFVDRQSVCPWNTNRAVSTHFISLSFFSFPPFTASVLAQGIKSHPQRSRPGLHRHSPTPLHPHPRR